jgi:hypothetical protein
MKNIGLRAYVRYDRKGKIVASSLIFVYSKPENGNWIEVPVYKDSFIKGHSTTKYLRAFIRYDSKMKIVPGSLVLRRTTPKTGNWVEVNTHVECLMCTTTTTTTSSELLALRLLWDNISYADALVTDSSDVANWNTLFNLPIKGGIFSSVSVVGNEVRLFGGSNITVKQSIFLPQDEHIIEIYDDAGCIVALDYAAFSVD